MIDMNVAPSPGAVGRRALKSVDVDLDHWQSLVRFAATSLVDRSGLSRTEFADRMHKTKSNFHGALLGRTGVIDEAPSPPFCRDLQRVLQTIPSSGHASSRPRPTLNSLYEELEENVDPDSGVHVLGAWFPDLCQSGPVRSSVEAFVRGEALRDLVKMTRNSGERDRLLSGRTHDLARRTIKDLLAIAGSAPYRGVPATHLLARLGPVALPEIAKEIWRSPVGFRSVRVLGRILWRAELRRTGKDTDDLRDADDRRLLDQTEALLVAIEDRPPLDPYPARSFFIEALRWAPADWTWVPERLAARAASPKRPVRERMYAVMLADLRRYEGIDRLIDQVRAEGADQREDGLLYAAAVMEQVRRGERGNGWIDEGGRVPTGGLNEWPPGRPEAAFVNEVLAALDGADSDELPNSVRAGTKSLVAEALLTLDGTRRRRACDVLGVAQLGDSAAKAISHLLRRGPEQTRPPRWLCEHAAFILGYLQRPAALEVLTEIVERPREYDPSILHAAAWGIGDICGHRPRWDYRHDVPVKALAELSKSEQDAPRWAAIYALAVTRQPTAQATLHRVIESQERDRLTRGLARWGIWLFDADNVKGRLDDVVRIPSSRTLVHG